MYGDEKPNTLVHCFNFNVNIVSFFDVTNNNHSKINFNELLPLKFKMLCIPNDTKTIFTSSQTIYLMHKFVMEFKTSQNTITAKRDMKMVRTRYGVVYDDIRQ